MHGLRWVLGAEQVPVVQEDAFYCRAPCKRLVNKADICPGQALPLSMSLPRGQPAEPQQLIAQLRGGTWGSPGVGELALVRSHGQCAFLPQTVGLPPPRAWPRLSAVSRLLLLLPALLPPWVGTAPPFLLPTGGEVWLNWSSAAAGIYL